MINDIQKARILSCYKTEEDSLEKGGKAAFIGEIRSFGGRDYIKTSDGWKFHGKGTGEKAQAHVKSSSTHIEAEKPKRFNPDDKLMFTPKFGDKFEVNFRGYSNSSETKAVIAGKFGQMEVDSSQLEVLKPETKKEPTFSEKYPGNTPELKPNHFSISGFLYHITNVTDKNIMYENTRRYSTRSERMTLKDFFERIDRGVVKYNKLPRLEEALSKVATSESDAYKNMILDLKNQTTGLKDAYIAKTKEYREKEFDKLVNKYGKLTYEEWVAKFPTAGYRGEPTLSKEGNSLRAKVASMKYEGREKYVKSHMKLAEMHYNQSLEKLGLKITEAGFDTNKVKLSSSSVGVNFSTEVTDGNKYMRAYTIIAEGPINAPHYRYLFTSNKKK